MRQHFRSISNYLQYLTLSIILSLLLVSCASTDRRDMDESLTEAPSNLKYDGWRLDDSVEFEAINVLMSEIDKLISNDAFDAATDKLERVLRIKPEYAPAWSRLSWLALQADSPKRAVQMAKRSNSFAYSNTKLQILNWSFILAASEILNDNDSAVRASQKIESLKAY